eukprot:Gregarina_sp_Poly_1__968@NODE_1235_length_4691_cov_205_040441_g841_i0_p1_GENE_NODE_1235_length_4691_cov_205_040441_g841_i0NODE_1235_length_4691_cov_205_040441_g841_i0_p1_ORF_typecomplete_len589_score24_22zfRING_2/PF13639_6/2_6e08zfRING_11/PF17123_5/0_0013zfrbx1/PF12678_7/0_021Zn_ribbon_17/PF17120_5/0_015zfC3HC4_2/PF13923_6/0_015zfC3HC4_2/PF13923_6/2_2e03zfANAPC11/PF12861_7/0_1zfC3HC4/PF00097_25/0_29zfC3HC4/PF00097_25/1_7e03zfRING_5/PF14634_6/1_8zfRING_UBOX/PF13445_6/5_3zfRINGlike/PF08746_11/20_N
MQNTPSLPPAVPMSSNAPARGGGRNRGRGNRRNRSRENQTHSQDPADSIIRQQSQIKLVRCKNPPVKNKTILETTENTTHQGRGKKHNHYRRRKNHTSKAIPQDGDTISLTERETPAPTAPVRQRQPMTPSPPPNNSTNARGGESPNFNTQSNRTGSRQAPRRRGSKSTRANSAIDATDRRPPQTPAPIAPCVPPLSVTTLPLSGSASASTRPSTSRVSTPNLTQPRVTDSSSGNRHIQTYRTRGVMGRHAVLPPGENYRISPHLTSRRPRNLNPRRFGNPLLDYECTGYDPAVHSFSTYGRLRNSGAAAPKAAPVTASTSSIFSQASSDLNQIAQSPNRWPRSARVHSIHIETNSPPIASSGQVYTESRLVPDVSSSQSRDSQSRSSQSAFTSQLNAHSASGRLRQEQQRNDSPHLPPRDEFIRHAVSSGPLSILPPILEPWHLQRLSCSSSNTSLPPWLNQLPLWVHDEPTPLGECVICRCPMECGDLCRSLPCIHVFHRDCIDPWLIRTPAPVCPCDRKCIRQLLLSQIEIARDEVPLIPAYHEMNYDEEESYVNPLSPPALERSTSLISNISGALHRVLHRLVG